MISVIIPTLNEQQALPATLQSLRQQRGMDRQHYQVIICDGGSGDNTLAAAENFRQLLPDMQVTTASTGRGSQMNAGAALATGEWLLFLHADTLLPPGGLAAIAAQRADAGVFSHRFSGRHPGLRLISILHNWRFRRTGIMYGDQAMFVRAELFRQLGGFPEQVMEDIRFSEKLLAVARPVQLPDKVVTDARKFLQVGVWRAFRWVCAILWRDRFGGNQKMDFFAEYR